MSCTTVFTTEYPTTKGRHIEAEVVVSKYHPDKVSAFVYVDGKFQPITHHDCVEDFKRHLFTSYPREEARHAVASAR